MYFYSRVRAATSLVRDTIDTDGGAFDCFPRREVFSQRSGGRSAVGSECGGIEGEVAREARAGAGARGGPGVEGPTHSTGLGRNIFIANLVK